MKEYIRQLQKAYQDELYYFVLSGCMILIDTCAGLNAQNGETSKTKFQEWFTKYLSQYNENNKFDGAIRFSAEECYKFRCRILHQSLSRIDTHSQEHQHKNGIIAFSIGSATIHCCNFEGVYFLDIGRFMEDVINAVERWIDDTFEESYVQDNLNQMIKITMEDPSKSGRNGLYIY